MVHYVRSTFHAISSRHAISGPLPQIRTFSGGASALLVKHDAAKQVSASFPVLRRARSVFFSWQK